MTTLQVPELSSLPSNMQQLESDRAAHAVTSADFACVETKVTTNQGKKKKKKKKNKSTERTETAPKTDQRNPVAGAVSDVTVNGGSRPKGPFIINSHSTAQARRGLTSKQRQSSNEIHTSREEEGNKTVTGLASASLLECQPNEH